MNKPTPRRRRFQVCVTEHYDVTFSVLAFSQAEAERMAEEIAIEQTYPHNAQEACERDVNVWKGRA